MNDASQVEGTTAESTALLIVVPEAESLVREAQQRHDPAPGQIPAHVTVLGPFLPHSEIDQAVRAELAELFAGTNEFMINFETIGRFPEVVYLEPEPADAVRTLTQEIAQRWPQAPPYEGKFADVIPHLSVAHVADRLIQDVIEAEISSQLPIRTTVREVVLLMFDGSRGEIADRFPLGA